MSPLTIRLARAAVLYFALGLLLGLWFALDRAVGALARPLHAELNLWGGVTLLIYGLGYHMLPRFAGRPLARPQLAEWQSWGAIIGVALASAGWLLVVMGLPLATLLLVTGGLLQLVAALLFILLTAPFILRGSSHASH